MHILIRRSANLIDVSPDGRNPLPPEIVTALAPGLTYTHKTFKRGREAYANPEGRYQPVALETRTLYRLDEGRFTCAAGFAQSITQKLRSLGHHVRELDLTAEHHRPNRFQAFPGAVEQVMQYRARQAECVAVMDSCRGGVIKAPTGFGKTSLICAMALRYPYANIHIVVKQVAVANRIMRQLRKYLPSVGMLGGGKAQWGRVMIITADSVHRSNGDADFLFGDECITGDADVATPAGSKKLKDVCIGDMVLCYNGKTVVAKRVTKTWARGKKPVMQLKAANGATLRCTTNHEVFADKKWQAASELTVDAELVALEVSGDGSTNALSRNYRNATVDAVAASGSDEATRSPNSLLLAETVVTQSTYPDTTSDQFLLTLNYRDSRSGQFWGHCSATALSVIRTVAVKIHGLSWFTAAHKSNGCGTRPQLCRNSTGVSKLSTILASVKPTYAQSVAALQYFVASLISYVLVAVRSVLPTKCLIALAGSDLRGGSVTTDLPKKPVCVFTRKDSTVSLLSAPPLGSDVSSAPSVSATDVLAGGCSTLVANAATRSGNMCDDTSQLAWSTNGVRLTETQLLQHEEEVFDIEVEGCHNFFANGLLVHNCHQLVTDNYANKLAELYRFSRNFGFSATPFGRMDGAQVRLEGLFGPLVFEMSYAEAVRLGLVVPIRVHWLPIRMDKNPAKGKKDTAQKRWGIWRNNFRNQILADEIRTLPPDEQVLVLVETVEHAVHLWQHLKDFALCYAEMKPEEFNNYKATGMLPYNFVDVTSEVRYNMQIAFEQQQLKRVIATDVWATGVDFAALQTVVRADARSSEILDTQGPGRAARLYDGKEYGQVIDTIDYWDDDFLRRSKSRYGTYKDLEWEQDWEHGKRQIAQADMTRSFL